MRQRNERYREEFSVGAKTDGSPPFFSSVSLIRGMGFCVESISTVDFFFAWGIDGRPD